MYIFLLTILAIAYSTHSISSNSILIIVSYDGFRYDYLNPQLTPHMYKLRGEGTFSEYMTSIFPTKTFPNHFTIATGMYSEVHGVVGNSYYDTELKEVVQIGERLFTQNKEIIPIWILNQLAGEGRHSGVIMWPGSPYTYRGEKPTYFQPWSHDINLYQRIDKMMEWLTDPKRPANLVMLYIEEPDYYAHPYGADSIQVHDSIKRLDNVTQYLDNQLRKYKLKDVATVVHVSDHGMASADQKNTIEISKYLQPNTYWVAETSPLMFITPKEGFENSIYDSLKKTSETIKTFDIYKKENMPEYWHYKHNNRTPTILLLAKKGYIFEDLNKSIHRHNDLTKSGVIGLHGYDPDMQKMRTLFMVRGPQIKRNHLIESFCSVNLYNFFASILEIKSVPNNNGTVDLYEEIMVPAAFSSTSSIILVAVGGVVLSLLLIGYAAVITVLLIKRQQNLRTVAALNKRFPQTFQQSIEVQHLLENEDA